MFATSSLRLIVYLLFMTILFVDRCCCIRCYMGAVNSDNIENCDGNCMKVIQRGEITRGCSSVTGGEVCDAAPSVTVCYCKTDLCNTAPGSQTLTSYTTLFSVLGTLFYLMF